MIMDIVLDSVTINLIHYLNLMYIIDMSMDSFT